MQHHHLEGFARARATEIVRSATNPNPIDEWHPPARRTLGDRVGRTLVALGARLLDEQGFAEAAAGSDRPRAA